MFFTLLARNFRKRFSVSLISLLSLILGFTCFIAIAAHILTELSYDEFHAKAGRIFRVNYDETSAEVPGNRTLPTVGPPVGQAMKDTYPEVEACVRFRDADVHPLRVGDKQFYEDNIFYADTSVFDVFSFEFLHGDPTSALSNLNACVITEAMATKYFDRTDVIGEVLTMDNNTHWIVNGVLRNLPANSHLQFGMLLPFDAFRVPPGYPVTLDTWGWISFHTYLLLHDDADPAKLESQFPAFISKNLSEARSKRFVYRLQPLTDIYMGDVHHGQIPAGNMGYVYSLGAAALLILLAAAFNYANLFLAGSLARAREMGIRKVSGAANASLLWQVIGESVLLSVAAMAVSGLVVALLRDAGGDLLKIRALPGEQTVLLCGLAVGIALVVGVAGGLYPAVLLSSLKSVRALAGNFRLNRSGSFTRQVMTVVQFMVCAAVLVSVFVINNQLRFLQDKHLGFEKDELLLLHLEGGALAERYPLIRQRLLTNPHVAQVSVGGNRMDGNNGNVPMFVEGADDNGIPMHIDAVMPGFFSTTGIAFVAGREFDERFPADSAHGVIINEAAAKDLGWTPEEALGQQIRVSDIVAEGEIIGVVRDYHFGSLHQAIKPLVVYYPRTQLENIYVRLRAGASPANVLASLSETWAATVPDFPFEFSFMDENIRKLYAKENHFSKLFMVFSAVAIAIACLGLYAMVRQEVAYRVREMGVRKVLGASASQIFTLISKKFFILVVIANLCGIPLTALYLNQWLNDFAYHTEVMPWTYAAAALMIIAFSFLTVLTRVVSAARANPVESLRSE